MNDLQKLYQEAVLQHHRQPRNAGTLESASHRAELHNPLCGDRTLVTLRVEGNVILEVRCHTLGCAICRASGSMMTEAVVGRTTGRALEILQDFCDLVGVAPREVRAPCGAAGDASVAGDPGAASVARAAADSIPLDVRLGPLAAFGEVKHYPNRGRCATLPWEALDRALETPVRSA